MEEIEIGRKERITILGLEYSSLRGDINSRLSTVGQISAVYVALLALMFNAFSGTHFAIFAALISIAWVIALLVLRHDIVKVGTRVQQLEYEINRRASEKLLVWENEMGGISGRYWSRIHRPRTDAWDALPARLSPSLPCAAQRER